MLDEAMQYLENRQVNMWPSLVIVNEIVTLLPFVLIHPVMTLTYSVAGRGQHPAVD